MNQKAIAVEMVESNWSSPNCQKNFKNCLRSNNFNGEIDLSSLPDSLENLDLANNSITGEVRISRLSSNLEALRLAGNTELTVLDSEGHPFRDERVEY